MSLTRNGPPRFGVARGCFSSCEELLFYRTLPSTRRRFLSSSSKSVTRVSVVSINAAMLAALVNAVRTTFNGSIIPRLEHIDVLGGVRVVTRVRRLVGHLVGHDRAVDAAVVGDLTDGGRQGAGAQCPRRFSRRRGRSSEPFRPPRRNAAGRRRRRAKHLLRPQRGWRAGRPRRGPSSASSRSRSPLRRKRRPRRR